MALFTAQQLSAIQDDKPSYRAAVAVVRTPDGRYLLGLGRNTGDDRTGMWCHPGGHMDNCYDSTLDTARRECLEETGVVCTPVVQLPGDPSVSDVAFVYCETGDSSVPVCANDEHADTGMFSVADMRKGLGAPVYRNVRKLIGQAEKYRRQRDVAASDGNPNHDAKGKFTGGASSASHSIRLPKSKKRLNIDQAVAAMKQMGYTLHGSYAESSGYDPVKKLVTNKWMTPSGKIVTLDTDEVKFLVYGHDVSASEGNPNHDAKGKFTSGTGTGKAILALQASRRAVHSTTTSAANLTAIKTSLLRRAYKLKADDVAGLTTNEISKHSLAAMSAMAAHDYEIGEQSHLATASEHGQHAAQLQKLIERGGFDDKTTESLKKARQLALEGVDRHLAGAKVAHDLLDKMPQSHTLMANIRRVASTVKQIYQYCTANKIVKAVIPFVIAECLSIGIHLVTGVPLPEAIKLAAAAGVAAGYHHLHEYLSEHHEHAKRERENRERQERHAKLKGYGLAASEAMFTREELGCLLAM